MRNSQLQDTVWNAKSAPAALPGQMEKPQAHKSLGISCGSAQGSPFEAGKGLHGAMCNGAGDRRANPLQFPEILPLFSPHPFDPFLFILFIFDPLYLFYSSFPKGHLLPSQAQSSLFNRGSLGTPTSPIAQRLLPGRARKKLFLLPLLKPEAFDREA